MVTLELKIPWKYLDFLNHTNLSKGVKCIFVFTKKLLRVSLNNLNHVPMGGLGSKLVRIRLGSTKDV